MNIGFSTSSEPVHISSAGPNTMRDTVAGVEVKPSLSVTVSENV